MTNQKLIDELSSLINETSLDSSQKLFSLSEDEQSLLYAIAYQYYRNGKYEEARHFFRFLTMVKMTERKYWMGLGASYQLLKKYPEAIECYGVAAIQDRDDPLVHWHAADCLFGNNQFKEALNVLNSAILVAKKDEKHENLLRQLELIQEAWINKPVQPEGVLSCQISE